MTETVIRNHKEVQRKANTYFFGKVIVNLLLIIIGAVLIAMFLRQMQNQTALVKQKESSTRSLTEAVRMLEENEADAAEFVRIFHNGNQSLLNDMRDLLNSGMFESLADVDLETRCTVMKDIVARSGVEYLFLMSPDGKIVLGTEPSLYNVNPAANGYMTQMNINSILKGSRNEDGSVEPVLAGNQYGSFYFYSVPLNYGGVRYMLVLGTSASVLEVQTASLRDISVVLSRAAVANNGFLFAVDRQNGLFLYYQNGAEILTGQSAEQAGLSASALEDGYAGVEVIKGVPYYCVSKQCGDQTVVCAVAETKQILSDDKNVLFWSIMGFVLIMFLCLAYAVVVRNDFVRNATKTDRKILRADSRDPIYFDKSIFRKVFPLMIAGVFLMYGLSFYTQTLLEISQGIERSHIALDEVSSRYTESLHNRDIIEQYYGGRSFAKAKLIAFLLEEDPSALNEPTEKIHSVYDEAGNLQHLTDDEGNPLRAVASSTRLQALADANDIDAIYVFDTDGHTIATNTPNWFFTVSHDETAQSYPFLDVLAGRKESFVQERMVNDLGEETQLIGVTFHYYTSLDEDGNTVYVSHKDYQYPEEGAAPVTMHTSMVQIALDNEVAARLMASTDVDTILSTHMLSDGFIVLFDSGEGHRCLYSPNAASIGITADELGVSPKAFSGDDYYGFANINGVQYFSCFRYMDGYFIGTALPRADMYQARLTISLLTALTCFVMILLLSLVVTLTTREEELMYATMSEDQAKNRLNSAIFNIILPSGRTAATTKAAARWDNRHIPWRNRSPEQKLATMISVVLGILILFAMLSCLGANRFFSQDSVIHYILSGRWDRGLNVFALSASALALVGVGIIVTIFRLPVRIMTSLLGTRSETIGHLLLSVVKYGGAIGAIFYCLFLLGIESGNLLASAGILSLVIGLGAQSLIKDILAGIFIVFEGEFRVGDIVTISGYRGTVLDIGLRTTKIMAPDGNVKIYNNSEISGVLNMTQEASVATCTISIEYGQDIDYVEAVLERELPKLKEMNPLILDGPTYLGVSNLGESGVDLLVIGRCFEGDVKGVSRFLNREVLKIFYRNDINVPFPNVTVSQLDTSVRKTMEDFVPDPDDTDVADQTEEES